MVTNCPNSSDWARPSGCTDSVAGHCRLLVTTWLTKYMSQPIVTKRSLESVLGFPQKKFTCDRTGLILKRFAPPTNSHERRHDLLFVGHFTNQKNLSLLIDAIAGTDLIRTVVGAGELERDKEKGR